MSETGGEQGQEVGQENGQAEPTPFAYVHAERGAAYRTVMDAFLTAKERFTIYLRVDDLTVDTGLGPDSIEALLTQLVRWGNLRADPDTSRVMSVKDFYRARYLYSLTAVGEAAERALRVYDEQLGQRGALQSVALADIQTQLGALHEQAQSGSADPATVHLLLRDISGRFSDLASNAQAFMRSLRDTIDLRDANTDAFIAYKQRLIDYIDRFIDDLGARGPSIARRIQAIEALADDGHSRLLMLAAERDAIDLIPDDLNLQRGPATGQTTVQSADSAQSPMRDALEDWRNRWRGLHHWFCTDDPHHPSIARTLREQATSAITSLLAAVRAINDRRSGRTDRSADYRTLAYWFAEAHDSDQLHRIWNAAFGLAPARHLTVSPETLDRWRSEPVAPSTPWADAPPMVIAPRLVQRGDYERRGPVGRIIDRSSERKALAYAADQEADLIAAALAAIGGNGPRRLSELETLSTPQLRLLLQILGQGLGRLTAPNIEPVEFTTADGFATVRVSRIPGSAEAMIESDDGTLVGPDLVIEIITDAQVASDNMARA